MYIVRGCIRDNKKKGGKCQNQVLTASNSQYTREKKDPRKNVQVKTLPYSLPILASSCSPRNSLAPFCQPIWSHQISFLLPQSVIVTPTTFSSIPFLFIYPYMPFFEFLYMVCVLCVCVCACHLFSFTLQFFSTTENSYVPIIN
jgi:hypothetical protein